VHYRPVAERSYIEKLLYNDWQYGKISRGQYNKQLREMRGLDVLPKVKIGSQTSRVIGQLESGPKHYMELLKQSGLSEKEFSTALFRLRERGLIERPSRGVYRKTPIAVRYV
jgi:DNA-binding HxlR family transcriptional regulator